LGAVGEKSSLKRRRGSRHRPPHRSHGAAGESNSIRQLTSGRCRPNSDFDALVIKESDEPRHRRSVPLYVALADLPVEVEVMVYTPQEVEEWSEVPQAFVTTAVREGITIYERRG